MDVSVIVVNWNTRELLHDCLKSVYEHASSLEFEVIVVDNASTDGSAGMVREVFPDATLIVNNTNRGYAAALNEGMRIARGRYFLVLNSDIIICDAAITKTVGYADKHPEAAVIGCQVWKSPDEIQPTCFRFPSLLNLFLDTLALNRVFEKNRFFGREHMRWWLRDTERVVDVVAGMFMLVRREAVEQVGLMDEDYFLLCEETDWCYRFSKAGWRMVFWPGAKIIHVHGGMQSRKKANLRMMVQFQKSRLIFFKKHYGTVRYLLARFLSALLCLFRCTTWAVLKFLRQLAGRDVKYETEKMRGLWWSLKFCALGCEPKDWADEGRTKSAYKRLKDVTQLVCALVYGMFCLTIRRRARRVVIYYHDLRKEDTGNFEKQMAYLARKCSTVKASEVLTARANGSEVIVAVTFDDGLESFCDNAVPILQKYKLPAAVSVPTGNLGKRPGWAWEEEWPYTDEIVMDEKHVAQLDGLGCEVLSHTVSHAHLTSLDDVRLKTELEMSRQALGRIIGRDIFGISYPYGEYSDKVCKATEQAGYRFGFSTEQCLANLSRDNFQVGRFRVSPADSMLKFKLKVSGAYQVAMYLSLLKKRLVRTRQERGTKRHEV
ncbi:MAG TPA: glycosyltransferase [Sedimentisphaerales bacterium]|nr:glycosyltransferase [Sedimentisphaerales bacterium]